MINTVARSRAKVDCSQKRRPKCLDQIIYTRAIRHQLDGILDAITRGDLDIAKTSLKMLLRGSPKDTLPSSL